jgi:glycerate kinase
MGGGVVWGLKAQLTSGFTAIAELTQLENAIQKCDGVITGEGCFDDQSLQGKVVGRVIKLAQNYQKPVFVVAGQTLLNPHPAHRVAVTEQSRSADLCEIAYLGSVVGKDLNLEKSLANPSQALAQQLASLRDFLLAYPFG